MTVRAGRAVPDPRLGALIELVCGEEGDLVDLVAIGKGLPGQGVPAEEAPPAFLEIEPARASRNEDVVNPGMGAQPLLNRRALVAGEIVGDQVEVAERIGLLDGVEQADIADGVPRAGRQGHLVPVPDAQGTIDPDFLATATVFQGCFDPMTVRRPAGRRGKAPRDHRTELIKGEDRPVLGRSDVKRDDLGPFGDEVRIGAGSPTMGRAPPHLFSPQNPTHLAPGDPDSPPLRRLDQSVERPMTFGLRFGGDEGPLGLAHDRTGRRALGESDDLASLRRGLRPAPGRSPNPSIPSALKRTMRSRTV